MSSNFKPGDKVSFRPGPRSKSDVVATVTADEGQFLVTKDAEGKERRIRPALCRAAA